MIEKLLETLRAQLQDAANVRPTPAIRDAQETLRKLEDEIGLVRQRYADKEAVRQGLILRYVATPEQIYAATETARKAHPEAWVGVQPKSEGKG